MPNETPNPNPTSQTPGLAPATPAPGPSGTGPVNVYFQQPPGNVQTPPPAPAAPPAEGTEGNVNWKERHAGLQRFYQEQSALWQQQRAQFQAQLQEATASLEAMAIQVQDLTGVQDNLAVSQAEIAGLQAEQRKYRLLAQANDSRLLQFAEYIPHSQSDGQPLDDEAITKQIQAFAERLGAVSQGTAPIGGFVPEPPPTATPRGGNEMSLEEMDVFLMQNAGNSDPQIHARWVQIKEAYQKARREQALKQTAGGSQIPMSWGV